MTDDATYGLGALEDPPDDRDHPLDALYAAEGIDPTPVDALPSSYRVPGMPPVLDQGSSPMCVAFGSSALKGQQDRIDQLRYFDFNEQLFFARIGGTADGAIPRAAMERLRGHGYPVVSLDQEGKHRIAAYYAARDPMRDGYLRGTLPRTPTARQVDVLAAFVASGGSVKDAAALVGVRPSTAKRHLADLRARSGLTTLELVYAGRAAGWLAVPDLEPARTLIRP